MTTTLTDLRSPAERTEAARDAERKPLRDLVWLFSMAPGSVCDHVMVAAFTARVEHPVTVDQVYAAIAEYEADPTATVALDELLDLIDCAECNGVHPAGEKHECAHGVFGESCYRLFHNGSDFCSSVDYR